jgi:hypothetical protein
MTVAIQVRKKYDGRGDMTYIEGADIIQVIETGHMLVCW